ncbi:MAG TPA: bi-domain-containing oxidoreductase, partial [Polyangiaceae bacterium]|nr:bi-domain-containing oxidoreductase [Polyangiaceae bacterium]
CIISAAQPAQVKMKQIVQHLGTGAIEVADVPAPAPAPNHVLIESVCSLVSPGTERMLLEFGRAGWLERARQQPDKVRQVLEKVRTDGLAATVEAVRSKLDQPIALGYCNVGRAAAVGAGVSHVKPGERVLSNGSHAELVRVPKNLVVRIPDNLPDEHAAFGVLGAIALQGIRLAAPTIGETFVVTGLGLVGLLAVQLLRANGCRVIGLDFESARLQLAQKFGAVTVDLSAGQDPERVADNLTAGQGVDGVLLCAATDSNEPVSQGARMCRKRGRIVLVGVTGLELSRADFYEKELSFQVSCSYGPGRYDDEYEQRGHDYPFGFVRWTEQRNIQAFLELAADGRLDLESLLTHQFEVTQAAAAYEVLANDRSALGILLRYPTRPAARDAKSARSIALPTARASSASAPVVSFFGAGNYAARVLMPAFVEGGARLRTLCNTGGVSGFHSARRHGFEVLTTDPQAVFQDAESNAIVVATRHESHADLVAVGLRSGKSVFVEKPLAIGSAQLATVQEAWAESRSSGHVLTIGFNRRFAPLAQRMKRLLDSTSGPKCIVYTVNAGAIPSDHWTQDSGSGGGRIVGEACHFIDFMRWLVGHPIREWRAMAAQRGQQVIDDCASITFSFTDGSLGTVHYFANGSKAFPKERVEVFAGGAALRLDDYRTLEGFGWRGFRKQRLWRQDKGQTALVGAFLAAVGGRAPAPIPIEEIFEVAEIAIECASALRPSLGVQ